MNEEKIVNMKYESPAAVYADKYENGFGHLQSPQIEEEDFSEGLNNNLFTTSKVY